MIDNFKQSKAYQGLSAAQRNAFWQWIENQLRGGLTGAHFKNLPVKYVTGAIKSDGDTLTSNIVVENGAKIDGVQIQNEFQRFQRALHAMEKSMATDVRRGMDESEILPIWDGCVEEEGVLCTFIFYPKRLSRPESGLKQPMVSDDGGALPVLTMRKELRSFLIGKNYLLTLRRYAKNMER